MKVVVIVEQVMVSEGVVMKSVMMQIMVKSVVMKVMSKAAAMKGRRSQIMWCHTDMGRSAISHVATSASRAKVSTASTRMGMATCHSRMTASHVSTASRVPTTMSASMPSPTGGSLQGGKSETSQTERQESYHPETSGSEPVHPK
jgi:hypothetical protein